jgi:hypothetical protein
VPGKYRRGDDEADREDRSQHAEGGDVAVHSGLGEMG